VPNFVKIRYRGSNFGLSHGNEVSLLAHCLTTVQPVMTNYVMHTV